jgi:hypothetical protein
MFNIAEQCGLMVPMGASILRMAVKQARRWADAGMPLRVAVNVSPVQFERPGFVELVLQTLADHGVSPHLLELEITETIAMADFARTRERVDALRAAGITISIDDFGIGYSNLSQLARLEYDSLKVDRSLVASIGAHGKTEHAGRDHHRVPCSGPQGDRRGDREPRADGLSARQGVPGIPGLPVGPAHGRARSGTLAGRTRRQPGSCHDPTRGR